MHLAQLTALWFTVADGPGGINGRVDACKSGAVAAAAGAGGTRGGEGGAWGG